MYMLMRIRTRFVIDFNSFLSNLFNLNLTDILRNKRLKYFFPRPWQTQLYKKKDEMKKSPSVIIKLLTYSQQTSCQIKITK